MSLYLRIFHDQDLNKIVNFRVGELKLGECIQLADRIDWRASIRTESPKFVLIGIPEDIGVRANGGVGGAHTAWMPALQALMNIQSTSFFTGEELMVLGHFDFSEWMSQSIGMDSESLKNLVSQIDDEVYKVIQFIISKGKLPIIIGGGHNNAYGLLKGASLALRQPVNCINLDAHSDYRKLEGRHSGNGFRYAKAEKYLDKYAIIGLHENYNSELIIQEIKADESIHFSFFEDIFLKQNLSYEQALTQAVNHTNNTFSGIELDLDCIGNVLSSAATPVGISVLQARQYINYCAQKAKACYLHLTEGATELANGRKDSSTGKLIAYLVSDFIKAMKP